MSDQQPNLTGGRRLARNVVWNLLGTGAPLLVAIVAIPMLIEGLGLARFGVLTLAWMVVGYFSLFDLGLGRALTKLVAEKLGKGQDDEIPSLIWTAMSLMAALGVLGAVVVAALSPWLVSSVLKIPVDLQPETLTAFYLLAASIPIVISTTGLRGISKLTNVLVWSTRCAYLSGYLRFLVQWRCCLFHIAWFRWWRHWLLPG